MQLQEAVHVRQQSKCSSYLNLILHSLKLGYLSLKAVQGRIFPIAILCLFTLSIQKLLHQSSLLFSTLWQQDSLYNKQQARRGKVSLLADDLDSLPVPDLPRCRGTSPAG